MSNETFSALSDYLIPLPELCGKLVTSHVDDKDFVVGQPIIIFNDNYDRRKLEFNLAFVLPNEEYQRLPIYENFIRKIAMQLTMLETFDGFLYDKARKTRIKGICEQIYNDLMNGLPQCYLVFDEVNVLVLDYEKKNLLLPPVIHDEAVPVPLTDLNTFSLLSYDFTVQSVISAIDGKKCVKMIRNILSLSENKVILCLQHLYYQGLIEFIDLFQVTNVYRVTSKAKDLLASLSDECVKNLSKSNDITNFDIFEYYTEMSDKIISDFLEENPSFLLKFDIELFVAYGVLKGILKRVHKYAVQTRKIRENHNIEIYEKFREMMSKKMLNGNTCMDEICIHFMVEQRSIETKLKEIADIFSK